MNFKIKKVKVSDEEKQRRISDYKKFENDCFFDETLFEDDSYDEYIDFKCANCGAEAELEADIVYELWDEYTEDFPILTCNKCGEETFIPKDICEKLHKKEEK